MATSTNNLQHVDEHPQVRAALDMLRPLQERMTALDAEDNRLWRLVNPDRISDEYVPATANERALAQHRQSEIRIERAKMHAQLTAAEQAREAAYETARADNLDAYAAIDAPLCAALDMALAAVLRIVEERTRLAESVTVENRGRQADTGPIVLTADSVEFWRAWCRAARRL